MDIITDGNTVFVVNQEGSLKRCGGIGDILAGTTGVYSYWANKFGNEIDSKNKIIYGCILASLVTRIAS